LNPGRPNEQTLFDKIVAKTLYGIGGRLEHGAYGPNGKALTCYASCGEYALLILAQLFKLKPQHLLQRLWYPRSNVLR
jgi:hypothetical protein